MTSVAAATSGSIELEAAFGRALPHVRRSASPPDRISYARDLWPRHHLEVRAGRVAEHRPGLVVWPANVEEVAAIVRFAAAEGVPLVPFGAGSGVCGGVLPDARTLVVDLKRLSSWRSLDLAKGPTLEVEAGAMGVRLEEDLGAKGLTLGHFPSSILCSTVGGWVAARSAGQCSGRYGKMEDMVAGLEVVTGTGQIVRMSRRTHGPDLTPLIIGSEGILGVVTAATLRLHPAPTARTFGAFSFGAIEAGWEAMREMFQAGLRPAVARLYDPFDTLVARLGRRHRAGGTSKAPSARGPRQPGAGGAALRTLLRAPRALNELVDSVVGRVFRGSQLVLIFEGARDDPENDLARAAAIAARRGAESLGEEPARHWLSHRYAVSYRQAPVFMSGAFSDTMEVAATWARLPRLYADVRAAIGARAFVMAHLSHAYPDGCSIYFTFAGSAPTPEEGEARYDAVWRDALDAAIGAGGTLSHHHGVGRSKAPKLGGEIGRGVDVVNAIRAELDPAGILNPGNLLPTGPRAAPPPSSPPPAVPTVDALSGIVAASGSATIGEVERALAAKGLRLGLEGDGLPALDTPIAAWLADGARGAPDPWLDPVDHLVAGFTARLSGDAELFVRPAPRRAVGPDLFALFLGGRERAGVITSVVLRARTHDDPRPLTTKLDRDPPATETESALLDRILARASRVA